MRSSSRISGGGPANGDALPRLRDAFIREPRLLIAKFRSREGNRGVFFLISVSSFTESPSSQTMVTYDHSRRSNDEIEWLDRIGDEKRSEVARVNEAIRSDPPRNGTAYRSKANTSKAYPDNELIRW